MKALCLMVCVLATMGTVAHADAVPVVMGNYGEVAQTTLFRGDVTGLDIGSITAVIIQDGDAQGGSSGVFSGFDLDFIVFDRDGDLDTTDDWVLPVLDGQTYVEPGVVRKGAQSPYLPTQLHPGPLFGLLDDAAHSIDHPTATLTAPDALYLAGYENLSVDTSHGWVSLGDGGLINVTFPLISVGPTETMYLFIGDVGLRDEFPEASVEIQLFVGAELVPITGGGARCDLVPGESANLDGTPPPGGDPIVLWEWDLDGDGSFDDGTGPVLAISFEYMTETLGLVEGSHTIALRTTTDGGVPIDYNCLLNLVPDPATWLLLCAGLPLAIRRRRRK